MRRLKYGIVFALLAAVSAYWAYRLGFPYCLLLFNLTLCWVSVSTAFLLASPRLLGKQVHGRLHPIAWVVYWPYILLSLVILKLTARLTFEPAVSQVTPHLLLGRRLSSYECPHLLPTNLAGTVDLTAEFAEPEVLRQQNYLCIPTLDTLNPTLEQLNDAIGFIENRQRIGPVFVHCAMGHGRSATVAAACLICFAQVDVHEAITRLQSKRPGVGLHPEQTALLHRYQQTLRQKLRAAPPPDTGSGGSTGSAD